MEFQYPYLLFLGDARDQLAAKTANGVRVWIIADPGSPEKFASFKAALGLDVPVFSADDILLKTIVRSNPGPVLWQNGQILYKWHEKKLPAFAEAQGLIQ